MSVVAQQDREIRAARNQALFRAVNEKIRAMNDSFAVLTGTFSVACECADSCCVDMIEISRDSYERVRESPYTFVVLPGHVDSAVERVVAEHHAYAIVEMPGAEARAILDEMSPTTPGITGRARCHATG